MKFGKLFLYACGIFLNIWTACYAQKDNWQELKGAHFIVFYNGAQNSSVAGTVLRKAEEYYNKVADQIGYSRYSNFWTWDERVKIIIFADQQTFMQRTGQPAWSQGYANNDSSLFRSRIIVTYRQQQGFMDGILPHEIGHLVLKDFVGLNTTLPIWFEEGVAQLQESDKKVFADQVMRALVQRKECLPFGILMQRDIRKESDSRSVTIFYAQSVSVVDFMIKAYGSSAFGLFCRNLKSGKSFQEALSSAYTTSLRSVEDLESKWLSSLKG